MPVTALVYNPRTMKNRIKEFREREGWTQYQLADMLHTTAVQIGRLEGNKRRLSDFWMLKLASVFQCKPEDLISEPQPPEERELIEKFRSLKETEKRMFIHMLDSITQPDKPKDKS